MKVASLLALTLCSLLATAACAAPHAEAAAVSADELTVNELREMTIARGALSEGSQKFTYEPSMYGPMDFVPYLAFEIKSPTGAAPISPKANDALGASLSVRLTGAFPGSPNMLVVDATTFEVLASTNGSTNEAGLAEATLTVPQTEGPKLALIRDERWVRPMEFELTLAQ